MQFFCIFFVFKQKLKPMHWCFVLAICLGAVLFLMFFPLFFRVKIFVDVLQNFASIKIFLFGVKLKSFDCKVIEKGVEITCKNVVKQKFFDLKKMKFFNTFFVAMLKQTKIFMLNIFLNFGNKNNAKTTALAIGSFLIFMNFFANFLHTKKQTMFCFDANACFNQNSFKFFGEVRLCFLMFGVLTSFLLAKKKEKNHG